mgnify:CR=1 FL=1
MSRIVLPAALAACLLAAAGPGRALAPADSPAEAADALPRLGLLVVREDLLVSGQPTPQLWEVLKGEGVTTVINLRPDDELPGRDERAEVEAAGLAYHHIPVAGPDGLTPDNASRLWRLVHGAQGRVLAHCGSGNRVGALLALAAAEEGGMAPEEALAFGKSAGLASPALEAEVRARLGLPPAE